MYHYSYHAYFILLHKSEKCVTERNRRLNLWSLFVKWGIQPVPHSYWLNCWKWLVPNTLCGSLISCQMKRVWIILLSVRSSPNSVTVIGSIFTCSKLEKLLLILNCSKLAKWLLWKYLYISSHGKLETSNLDSR